VTAELHPPIAGADYSKISRPEFGDRHSAIEPTNLGAVPSYSSAYKPRRGLSIPALTVLDTRGCVIEDQQRKLFRFIAQNGKGADIIFGCGTTGEARFIANNQRQRLIEIEADEVSRINIELAGSGMVPIEAWAGVTAETRRDTLANLEFAMTTGIHAAVIAPLSIQDIGNTVEFFQREVSDLFDKAGRWLPIFLYDNADIVIDPRIPHIKTRDVKRLSRLPFVYGIKVSASRRVLGNYTKGAGHFKDAGDFGIYVGNAMLMFRVFRLEDGLFGRVREYWNRYLLHNELPIGVVAGPANVWPLQWQRAWRACYSGDEQMMAAYKKSFERFEAACCFPGPGRSVDKMIACLKYALRIDGVIESDSMAAGSAGLSDAEREIFLNEYRELSAEW